MNDKASCRKKLFTYTCISLMQNYLIAYYSGNEPTFKYTESVESARVYALAMATVRPNTATDVMSIIEIATDRVVFYGKGQNLVAKLNAQPNKDSGTGFSFLPLFRPILTWMGLTVSEQI